MPSSLPGAGSTREDNDSNTRAAASMSDSGAGAIEVSRTANIMPAILSNSSTAIAWLSASSLADGPTAIPGPLFMVPSCAASISVVVGFAVKQFEGQ